MRILWVSNAPWAPSGYGEQTALFVPRLANLGHELGIVANYGLSGAIFPLADVPVYPGALDWANPVLQDYVEHFEADIVICLCDAWVMRPDAWPDVRVAMWAPIDHYPIPPAVLAVLNHERVRPIAMSRDGEKWMERFELNPLYVPHGINTETFKPQTKEEKDAIRDRMEIPRDAFLVGMVAANKGNPAQPRKSFPQAFDGFARFARRVPDAYLYVHSQMQEVGGHGIDLGVLAAAVGIPAERLRATPMSAFNAGIPKEFVADLYAGFDVLLNPSAGEGFGIPIIEAQACGVPVIVSNHSAMPELCGAGWQVEGERHWDALQTSFAFFPYARDIEVKLKSAYEHREDEDIRKRAREFALTYDADRVTEMYWKPVLEKLSRPREVGPFNGKESRQVRRAKERAVIKADLAEQDQKDKAAKA